jgi:acetyl-CoA carboxylase carboxyl transferase subunit beta
MSAANAMECIKDLKTMVEATIAQNAPARQPLAKARKNVDVPAGLWLGCPGCTQMVYRKEMEERLFTCPHCRHHFRVPARQRVAMLVDQETFEEMDVNLSPVDRLAFVARKAYKHQLAEAQKASQSRDAVLTGAAFVKGRQVILAVMDFSFLAGSMGAVVGEKLTRAIERATLQHLPLVVVSCSGGARMQESAISLMQMAKTSAALARHHKAGGLFLSILTDPTTGGVTASFAMLGDLIFAEPKAMIGFAGPRTIANTIRVELPEGFQTAEFLMEKGFVDRIVPRSEMRSAIARTIDFCGR